MKVKLSREKIINNLGGIRSLLQKDNNTKLNYAVIKIEEVMSGCTKLFQKELESLDKKRVAICEKHCLKDENGKPIIKNNNYEGLKDNEEFEKEIAVVAKEKETYLKEEIEIEGYRIKEEWLDDRMQGNAQKAIIPFIEKEDEKEDNEIKIH